MLSSKSAIPISLDADASRQLPARIEFYVGSITHGESHHFLHTRASLSFVRFWPFASIRAPNSPSATWIE